MPKKEQPHFDVVAVLQAVAQQDVGLRISTNNPDGFRRILYAAMRANPALRCHAYVDPRTPAAFFLLKTALPSVTESVDVEE